MVNSALPPFLVGRMTLVAAGHVTTCDTNVSIGIESTNHFCRSHLKGKKGDRCFKIATINSNTPLVMEIKIFSSDLGLAKNNL